MYFQGQNAEGTYEMQSGAVEILESGTYYFRAKSDFGCWGEAVHAVVDIDNTGGGTTATDDPHICLGSNAAIELTGHGGTIQKWEKEFPLGSGNWTEISVTSNELVDNLNVSGTYRYRAVIETTGACEEVYSTVTEIKVNNPEGVSEASGEGECNVSSSDWIHLFDKVSNRIIASVNSNGQNLGDVSAELFYQDKAQFVPSTGHCLGEQSVLNRNFIINSTVAPSSPVNVRFYFTDDELAKLIDASLSSHSTYPSIDVTVSDPSSCLSSDDVRNIGELFITQIHFSDPAEKNAHENGTFSPGVGEFILHVPTPSSTGNNFFGANYLEITVDKFSEFWIHGTTDASPLPVELLYFNATKHGENNVELNWATATELNNDYFQLERSRDGVTFETITVVDGAGNSTIEIEYTHIDRSPFAGMNYYRLKQVDFDGQFEYFPIQAVELGRNMELNVFPNPADNKVTLEGSNIDANQVVVLNAEGKIIQSVRPIQLGDNHVEIEISTLPKGVYIIQHLNQFKRFVKL